MEQIKLELSRNNMDNIEIYSNLLQKSPSSILNEALQIYFDKVEEDLAAQSHDNDGANTNLNFNEFWDGVDI